MSSPMQARWRWACRRGDDAIASVDPGATVDPETCAIVDGVDVCVELESSTGDPLEFCYCVSPLAPEFAAFDGYFFGPRACAESVSRPSTPRVRVTPA